MINTPDIVAAGAAFIGGMRINMASTMFLFIALGVPLIIMALFTMRIAQKTGTPNSWMAWIPGANFYLLAKMAQKPVLWFALCLIPGVQFVIIVMLWMKIAERINRPSWWGIMTVISGVNLVFLGIMAYGKSGAVKAVKQEKPEKEEEEKEEKEEEEKTEEPEPRSEQTKREPAEGDKFCPNCGNPSEEDSKFCAGCGREFPEETEEPEQKFCTKCGEELETGSKFCPKCGVEI